MSRSRPADSLTFVLAFATEGLGGYGIVARQPRYSRRADHARRPPLPRRVPVRPARRRHPPGAALAPPPPHHPAHAAGSHRRPIPLDLGLHARLAAPRPLALAKLPP